MSPFLRFALWTCPESFRTQYGAQVLLDYAESNVSSIVRICADLIVSGLALRLESVMHDVSFGVRVLAKAPLSTATAILAIALAIGANIAVAGTLHGVLFRPLPFADPNNLIVFNAARWARHDHPGFALSYPDAADIAARNHSFSALALEGFDSGAMTGNGASIQLSGADVSAPYFSLLGVKPLIGRFFGTGDAGSNHVVISERLWKQKFDADSGALGKTLHLDGRAYTIIGVAPADFQDPTPSGLEMHSFWLPIDPHLDVNRKRNFYLYAGLARLRPGMTTATAHADLERISGQLSRQYPVFHPIRFVSAVPLPNVITGPVQGLLWLVYGAVMLILLIACANVANLHFVRVAYRANELALRRALGASRARLIAQLSVETALLACAGGIAGLAIAYGALRFLAPYASAFIPRWDAIAFDGTTAAYTVGLVVVTTVLAGVIPALVHEREAGRFGRTTNRVHEWTVILQVALAMVIVIAAGEVFRSLLTIAHVPMGFDSERAYVVKVDGLTLPQYRRYATLLRFSENFAGQMRRIPGVTDAAVADSDPFEGKSHTAVGVSGKRSTDASVELNAVTPGYFSALHIPLMRGRDFAPQDASRQVAIVNAAFARAYFGTIDVIGSGFVPYDMGSTTPWTIVGVSGDTRNSPLVDVAPTAYIPFAQMASTPSFLLRTSHSVNGLSSMISLTLKGFDKTLPVPRVEPLTQLLQWSMSRSAFVTTLFGALALIAFFLALTGVYAVAAFAAQSNTRNFAIRLAIGARARDILAGVSREALISGLAGAAGGLLLLAIVRHLLATLLFQTSPLDPTTIGICAAFVVTCAVGASVIPAARTISSRIVQALRYE